MAIPSYTTDLLDITNGEETSGYSEPTGATAGAITMNDSDFFIQGTACCSKTQATTGSAGIIFASASGKTVPADGAVMFWMFYAATSTLATEAAGGFRTIIGSSASAFKQWYVKGVDTYAYGGWFCVPISPTIAADATTGSPTATLQYFGSIAYVPGPGYAQRGNPLGLDAIRYGRCESRIAGGSTADGYAKFGPAPNGYCSQNDNQTNRWGLIQAMAVGVHSAGYQVQGLVIFGYGAATDFRDSNTSIIILDTKKVTANFNTFEVRNALSRVDLTAISFTALGTVSRGRWITTDNADVNIDSCVFTDMSTFGFASNSTILNSTFRRCDIITQNGATITGCTIDNGRGAKAMVVDNISLITNTSFISDGTGYAIEGFSAAGDYTITNVTFSGYASSNGTSGNEAIHVLAASGIVNINISGGNTPTIHSAGATVNVIIPEKTLTLTGLVTGSDISILTAGTTTERTNVQENAGTTYAFNYTYAANDYIDVGVFKAGYVPFYIRNYLLGNTNSSLPISQVIDRAYLA